MNSWAFINSILYTNYKSIVVKQQILYCVFTAVVGTEFQQAAI